MASAGSPLPRENRENGNNENRKIKSISFGKFAKTQGIFVLKTLIINFLI